MQVLGQVRSELAANPDAYADGYETILSIVQAGEAICTDLVNNGTPASSVSDEAATSTPEGFFEVTATPGP